jgi:predicted nucleic acid binding AN1-type Zn finger protein
MVKVAVVLAVLAIACGCIAEEGGKNVTCGDGTPYGQCSPSRPYFCNYGSLMPEISSCGCPSGYKASGDACERIRNCWDGTKDGECSLSKPLYCLGGVLMANASGCGCPANSHAEGGRCIENRRCGDGTYDGTCSVSKPLYCDNGTFAQRAGVCGCPEGYEARNDTCERIILCSDGTRAGGCTANRPLYCDNGTFVSRASVCGCQDEYVQQGEGCLSVYELGAGIGNLSYVLRGVHKEIRIPIYSGLNEYQANLSRYYVCGKECPSDLELDMKYIDEPKQRDNLLDLVDRIQASAQSQDDMARIAISLVQNIPYDTEKAALIDASSRYPYEVIYDDMGICGEKSMLLAFLLRELGFGVSLLEYKSEDHMAVGIKCDGAYDYLGTGYCFVETTVPIMPTFSNGDYGPNGKLKSVPSVLKVSDGSEFSAAEDYKDAQEWDRINGVAESSPGRQLTSELYDDWQGLVAKYGIPVES